MNLSQAVAGGSCFVDVGRGFSLGPVEIGEIAEPSPTPSTSTYGWKFALQLRIWSGEGPKGNAARSVLTALLWSSDGTGRTWLGMASIMEKSGLGNERTVRRAIQSLTNGGWLRLTAQTWSSLTAEQLAVGRKAPRRGDVGQAPNLYTVLGGPSLRVTPEAPTRPGLASTTVSPVDETPLQICRGGQGQISPGGPGANLPPDPDPLGSVSRIVSEQSERGALDTHDFSKTQEGKGDWGWLESWQVVVQAHATKTTSAYGLAPMEPDMKRGDRKALADCLDGASTEVAAKLRARGIEREFVEVRRELAERAIARYFRNDTPHLRKTKHALRDLPREWHARVTDAMQAILRESYDKLPARRPFELQLEQAGERRKVEKPAETASSAPVEKPMRVEDTSTRSQNARKVLDSLMTAKEVQRPKSAEPVTPPSKPQAKPALPDWLVAETELERVRKQAQKATETPQAHRDESETIERSMGRPGAPRWGALSPRPMKVRRVSRPVIEPEGTGGGGSPPSTE